MGIKQFTQCAGRGRVQAIRVGELLFTPAHLTLVKLQRSITILRELLRAHSFSVSHASELTV